MFPSILLMLREVATLHILTIKKVIKLYKKRNNTMNYIPC